MFEPIPFSDTLIILLLGTLVVISAFLLERLAVFGKIQKLLARKCLHVIAIGGCTLAAGIIKNHLFFVLLVSIAEVFLIYLVAVRNFFTFEGKKSWGIVYFPLAFIALLLLFPNNRFLIVAPMGLLALADAAATLFGEKFARSFFTLTGDRKSVIGSSSFVLVSFVWFFLLGCFGYGQGQSWPEYIILAISISLITAASEALGSSGRDNLYVPAISAFILWAVFKETNPVHSYLLATSILVLTPAAYFAYRWNVLTNSGAVAAVLVGIGIWIIGGFSLFPILVFFITGSLLAKLPGKGLSDSKSFGPRDSLQVFSNGGVAWLLANINCIWPNEKFFILYLIACAAASADTWGSEIGTRYGKFTIDILRFKKVPAGVSGGISIVGFLATFFGAFIIALFAWDKQLIIYITIFGVIGSVIDSLLGSLLQAKYEDSNGNWTDIPHSKKIGGFDFITNDTVNFISLLLVVLIAAFIV